MYEASTSRMVFLEHLIFIDVYIQRLFHSFHKTSPETLSRLLQNGPLPKK